MEVLVTASCPTLCDPIDCSPPGPSVQGSLQVRILECAAIPFIQGSKPGSPHSGHKYIFDFKINCQIFSNGAAIFYIPSACENSRCSTSSSVLGMIGLFNLRCSGGCREGFHFAVFICISLVNHILEHLFMCLTDQF